MKRFENKVVLVTGSGRGIGSQIARRFAGEGADIVINFFRNRSAAEDVAASIRQMGRNCLVVKANVGELSDIDRLYEAIEQEFGGLDILIHNAASGYNRPALQQKARGWDWTMNINARSLLFGAQRATALMEKKGGGAIVAISSLGATRVLTDYVVVGASKAALEALVRYLGVELASHNIRVNGVSPGIVLTGALEHFDSFREGGQALIAEVAAATPARRLCTSDDIAGLAMFLCSPDAAMVCGQTIVLDGGYSLLAR